MPRIVKRDTRETLQEKGKRRPMCFEWDPGVGRLMCWPKGLRQKVVVPLAAIWHRGMKEKAEELRRRKRHV
jgi:hypothetical protein